MAKIILFSIAVFLVSGCINKSEEVTGLIINVEFFEMDKLDKLTIKDSKGKIWNFEGGRKSFVDFSSHHLKEHQMTGNEVKVRCKKEKGTLFIVSIEDVDKNDH